MSVNLDKSYAFVGLVNDQIVCSEYDLTWEDMTTTLAACTSCANGEWVHGTSNCPVAEMLDDLVRYGIAETESISMSPDFHVDKVRMIVRQVPTS